jgi:F-type H+-transporting ATPase subunit gamma
MPSLKDLRNRISSVKNTKQMTRAMRMIAASKLRRVQDKVRESRPFSDEVLKMIAPLFGVAQEPKSLSPFFCDPEFLKKHGEQRLDSPLRVRIFVVTSDRGLCGAYNNNVLKKLGYLIGEELGRGNQVKVDVVGRKGMEYVRTHHGSHLNTYFDSLGSELTRDKAIEGMIQYREQFVRQEFDVLKSVFTEFTSLMVQKVKQTILLPIIPGEMRQPLVGVEGSLEGLNTDSTLIEPSSQELAEFLVEAYLDSKFYQMILESVASEYGARMLAMENASKNADEMIDGLTLDYNRQRQSNITTEMLEIIGGAEALSNS